MYFLITNQEGRGKNQLNLPLKNIYSTTPHIYVYKYMHVCRWVEKIWKKHTKLLTLFNVRRAFKETVRIKKGRVSLWLSFNNFVGVCKYIANVHFLQELAYFTYI